LTDRSTTFSLFVVETLHRAGERDAAKPANPWNLTGAEKPTMMPRAGHYPQTEMPDRTNPIIVDFLKRAAGQAIDGQSAS